MQLSDGTRNDIRTHMHVYIHTYIHYIHTYTYSRPRNSLGRIEVHKTTSAKRVCMYVRMCVCMYVGMYICMYEGQKSECVCCTYVRMYVCMLTCMHVCMKDRSSKNNIFKEIMYVCMHVRMCGGQKSTELHVIYICMHRKFDRPVLCHEYCWHCLVQVAFFTHAFSAHEPHDFEHF